MTSRRAVERAVWRPGDPVAPLARLLARGGVLALPTESSYGLAADPRNPAGVATIYRIKSRIEEREAGKPLPVVVAGISQLPGLGIDPDLPILWRLSPAWPAPLSLVLPLLRPLPAAAGADSLAVRVPAHENLRALLAALGTGLTATSANRAGEPPILDPQGLADLLAGHDAAVVDGGVLPGGPPSTLVEAVGQELRVLRQGAFPLDRLHALWAAGAGGA
jgi:L-threonylcarbamoyladenylate synthase